MLEGLSPESSPGRDERSTRWLSKSCEPQPAVELQLSRDRLATCWDLQLGQQQREQGAAACSPAGQHGLDRTVLICIQRLLGQGMFGQVPDGPFRRKVELSVSLDNLSPSPLRSDTLPQGPVTSSQSACLICPRHLSWPRRSHQVPSLPERQTVLTSFL